MNRREHMPPGARVLQALKRARFLFILAILFRLQGWIFAWGTSPWTDLLKVDILNVMGATAALLAFLALFSGIDRVRWAVMAGTVMAVLSPGDLGAASQRDSGAAARLFVPSGDMFSIFPVGRVSGVRHGRGQHDPPGGARRMEPRDAVVGAAGLRPGVRRALLR